MSELGISAYRDAVRAAAAASDGREVILNRSMDHAAIIIAEVFRKSRAIVKIVTGNLVDQVYGAGEVVTEAVAFTRRGGTVEIISEHDVSIETNVLLQTLQINTLLHRVRLYRSPSEVQELYSSHFILGDGLYFRVQRSRTEYEAVVQFGNAEQGTHLDRLFELLKSHSREINLTQS